MDKKCPPGRESYRRSSVDPDPDWATTRGLATPRSKMLPQGLYWSRIYFSSYFEIHVHFENHTWYELLATFKQFQLQLPQRKSPFLVVLGLSHIASAAANWKGNALWKCSATLRCVTSGKACSNRLISLSSMQTQALSSVIHALNTCRRYVKFKHHFLTLSLWSLSVLNYVKQNIRFYIMIATNYLSNLFSTQIPFIIKEHKENQ